MELRALGDTGLTVSRLGLGLAALGRPGYMTLGHADDLAHRYDLASMQQHAGAVLDAAYAAGVRYFDTARSYGEGERFLASWLHERSLKPGSVTVGSKWGYTYTAGWQVQAEKHEIKEHSLAVLRRQIVESRRWLGPYLGLYQIHSATLESGVLTNHEVLHELSHLRADGLKIGLSVTGARQSETIRRALEIEVDGEPLFDCVQATWNLLEPSAGPALAQAHAAGRGVIVKEALANGRLTTRNLDPAFAAQRTILEAAAHNLSTTLDALALASALAQPWADVVLSGAATAEQVRSNARAIEVKWDATLSQRLYAIAENVDVYWSKRGELIWN